MTALPSSSGRSVATTMGFSALDGLPMGTRCGNIDPGILLYLMPEQQLDADAIEQMLYRDSGDTTQCCDIPDLHKFLM